MTIEKIEILWAVLELPVRQHYQFSANLAQLMGQIDFAV